MPKKHQYSGGRKLTAQALQVAILQYLLAHPKKALTARQIGVDLKLDNNKDAIEHAIARLVMAGSVTPYPNDKFGVALDRLTLQERPAPKPGRGADQTVKKEQQRSKRAPDTFITGKVDMTRTGAAYVVTDDMDSDVYVSPRYVNNALNGDLVRVLLFQRSPQRRGGPARKPEGEIVEVLHREQDHFIGTLQMGKKHAVLVVDNMYMHTDLYVPLESTAGALHGDTVVVRVTDWQEGKGRMPMAKVTKNLGRAGGNDFEMNKILINAGFELEPSPEALAEAGNIPAAIPDQEIARRRDFRDVLTFTIDPEDARDFDDALSYRTLETGHTEVGIHIADVTYYLKPGSHMDKEAFKRSTSVYLVDRVCPMLPEQLSNNLCSLVPEEDRLTFSVVVEFDAQDRVVKRWFGRTVIHSDKRLTYEEAQSILEKKPFKHLQELPTLEAMTQALLHLGRLSKAMRKRREKNGSINFDSEEVRFRLAEDGTPLEAFVKERKDAHLLIEDFMLLANQEVAVFVDALGASSQEVPFIYRVHDLPNMEKVAEFARFAYALGHPMKTDTPKQIAASFNSLMHAAEKDERLKPLMPLAIRTMAKAIYDVRNIGHYGLGFSHYAHFTSPIRRYSDVLAHRILERNLDGKMWRMDADKLSEQCKHISSQERKAADAERESVKLKQAEYLSTRIGQVYTGIVSGFIDRGFFVELPDTRAEGLVSFRDLDDLYALDESGLRAKGKRFGKTVQIGDRVDVRIASVDLHKRQIDMEWIEG